MKQFLHIGFKWENPTDSKKLKEILDKAIDWIKYAPDCWILWTSSDPDKWWARLKPLLKEKDYVFICKLDINVRQGLLPEYVWEWINKDRS